MLRQRSRPYLFSNSVAPPIVGASLKAIEICSTIDRAARPARGQHAVLPRGDDRAEVQHRPGRAPDRADHARRRRAGRARWPSDCWRTASTRSASPIPVVPQGKARIRVQVSAAHSRDDLEFAIEAFTAVRDELKL